MCRCIGSSNVLLCSDKDSFLRLGKWLVEQGRFSSPEDIFYLTVEARADLLAGGSHDWQGMIQARRAERDHDAMITVPDTIQDWREAVRGTDTSSIVDPDGVFRGIPISGGAGCRTSSLCSIDGGLEPSLSWRHSHGLGHRPGYGAVVQQGSGLGRRDGRDIGTWGIIAREYGLPAVANVSGVLARLKEGEHISLDAERGESIVPVGVEDTV